MRDVARETVARVWLLRLLAAVKATDGCDQGKNELQGRSKERNW
jgi:hypothetical protein